MTIVVNSAQDIVETGFLVTTPLVSVTKDVMQDGQGLYVSEVKLIKPRVRPKQRTKKG